VGAAHPPAQGPRAAGTTRPAERPAFVIDLAAASAVFANMLAVVSYAATIITGDHISWNLFGLGFWASSCSGNGAPCTT
jgi:hypothetical protein